MDLTIDEGLAQGIENKNSWGRSTKLEFSKFDGSDLDSWLLRAKYFFSKWMEQRKRIKLR